MSYKNELINSGIMVEDENPERLKQVLDELEAVANMMLS